MNDALPPGTSLQNGAFVLQDVIARGGSGFTYVARDTILQRQVAIKEFFPPDCRRFENRVRERNFTHSNLRSTANSKTTSDERAREIEYSIQSNASAETHSSAEKNAFASSDSANSDSANSDSANSEFSREFLLARADFAAEARALARFSHRNIVQVFAVFEENDSAYLVTEFVRGQTLQHVVEARGFLPESEAIALLLPICDAVSAVHRGGLLHGDIKPANVILDDDGRVVLLDFGLTRPAPTGAYVTTLLVPQSAVGTAGYAPLEQYSRAARTGTWSDVYALAATLWHFLSGDAPPDAPDRASGTPLPDLEKINPGVSAPITHLLHQALAMDALARPQSVEEFAQLLRGQRLRPRTSNYVTSSTRFAPPNDSPAKTGDFLVDISTRPSQNDENSVAMLIILSILMIVAFLFVMLPRFFF